MNNNELQIAKEELKNSIKVVSRNLKILGKVYISEKKAVLKRVENNIINTYKQLQSAIYIQKLNREIAHYQKEREEAIKRAELLEEANRRARNRENTRALEEQQIQERKLKFKNSISQKTNAIKSRIGKVKNTFLKKLSFNNIETKLSDMYRVTGITGLGTDFVTTNRLKNDVTNLTSEQIAKLTEYRINKQKEREEKNKQSLIAKAEAQEEANRRARNRENTRALEEQQIQERKLKFKNGISQKTNSIKSKIGRTKNTFLKTLTTKNIDLKIRDIFDKIEIKGLTAVGTGMIIINEAKNNVLNFTSEQIAKITEYRINKQKEKEEKNRQNAIRNAEIQEERNRRTRNEDHYSGMIEALNTKERDEYDSKHKENMVQKQLLIQALQEQKNKLLNARNEELGEKSRAR